MTPLTNAPAKENVARVTAGDLRGKIGKVHAVDKQAGQTHQMWATYTKGKIYIWMKDCADEKTDLKVLIEKWEKGATPEEKADQKKVRDSYEAALRVLQPLEKKMREFEPKMRAAKTEREKTKVAEAKSTPANGRRAGSARARISAKLEIRDAYQKLGGPLDKSNSL